MHRAQEGGDYAPGDRIRVVHGTFDGKLGQVLSREEAAAVAKSVGGQILPPFDPPGSVWVLVPVFGRQVAVCLESWQITKEPE
jgi:transcription antitermination factor NusG